MIGREEIEKIFRRLFKSGDKLRRLPKSRAETQAFLALAASELDPQDVYSEPELNGLLEDWLADFASLSHLDYVTVRRSLVDHGFVLRDQRGESYRSNQVVINSAIKLEARSVQPKLLFDEAKLVRRTRRRQKVT